MTSPARQGIGTDLRATNQLSLSVLRGGQLLADTYRIVRLIGEGGMGLVYEATHARLAGRYAIKVILQGLSGNVEASARFDREARITSWLQHPNIVQVVDFNRLTDGTEYLVMEYLQGETLAERLLRPAAIPLSSVVSIVQQLASALAAAHSHGIVHRDLKPANVFLLPVEGSSVELVKVLDFGISKVHDATEAFRGAPSGLMGTPQYMAPEQCRGQGADMSGASDQFSLAVLTYEMLTGRSPFFDDSIGGVLTRVLYEDPPAMGLSPDIEQVVRRGLAKAIQDRFPSVLAFASALQAATLGDQGAEGASSTREGAVDEAAVDEAAVGEARGVSVTLGARSRANTLASKRPGWRSTIASAAVVSLAVLLGVIRDGRGKRMVGRPAPTALLADATRSNDAVTQPLQIQRPERPIVPAEAHLTALVPPLEKAPSAAALARYRRHHQTARPARTVIGRQQAPRRDVFADDDEILPLSFDRAR